MRAPRDGVVDGGALRAGRAGAARRARWWSSSDGWRCPRASRSSRSARATACRTRPASSPTADKIAFVDRADAPPGHRSIEVSAFVVPKWVPQMADAARGVRRHHAAGRASATPRWCRTCAGLDARRRRRRHARSRSSPPRPRRSASSNINQSIDESLATLRGGLRRRAARTGMPRARLPVHVRSAVRSKAPSPPARGRRGRRRAARPRRLRGRRQRHDRRRASRAGRATVLDAVHGARAARRRSRCTSTTRAAPRSPTCWRRSSRRHDVRRLGRRPRRLPVRAGRLGQPRHRRPALHAGRAGHRDRRVAARGDGRGVAPAGWRIGHPPALQVPAGGRLRPAMRPRPAGGTFSPRPPLALAGLAAARALPARQPARAVAAAGPRASRVRVRAAALRLRRLGLQPEGRRQRPQLGRRVHRHPGLSARKS